MTKEQFLTRLKKRELLWDCSWIGAMVLAVVAADLIVWFSDAPAKVFLMVLFVPFIVMGVFLQLAQPFEKYLRRTALKKYWIEDHGNVIKLFGAVRIVDTDYAYRDILSIKPGLKIVDDADTLKQYGCTIAAVLANEPN